MADLQVQPSINDTRAQALLALIERLGEIDLSPLLVYRMASVSDSALPFLAWQFDVLSPLWQLLGPIAGSIDALTDIDPLTDIDSMGGAVFGSTAAQRALLEEAIALHRVRGTPSAIKRALVQLGWTDVALLEGQSSWGGTAYPTSQGWAVFRVQIGLSADDSIGSGIVDLIDAAVSFYKPARAWLDTIEFVLPPRNDCVPMPADALVAGGFYALQIDSTPVPTDPVSIAIVMGALIDQYGPAAPIHNAHYLHSGITYGAGEPAVADSALVINGSAVLQGG